MSACAPCKISDASDTRRVSVVLNTATGFLRRSAPAYSKACDGTRASASSRVHAPCGAGVFTALLPQPPTPMLLGPLASIVQKGGGKRAASAFPPFPARTPETALARSHPCVRHTSLQRITGQQLALGSERSVWTRSSHPMEESSGKRAVRDRFVDGKDPRSPAHDVKARKRRGGASTRLL